MGALRRGARRKGLVGRREAGWRGWVVGWERRVIRS